jgi:hypothetical protein
MTMRFNPKTPGVSGEKLGGTMFRILRTIFAAGFFCFLIVATGIAQDVPNSFDPPGMKRYEGSEIIGYRRPKFDEYLVPLGPPTSQDPPAYKKIFFRAFSLPALSNRGFKHSEPANLGCFRRRPEGRIVLGEESSALRERVKNLAGDGKKKIVLNMTNVTYIDSAGLGGSRGCSRQRQERRRNPPLVRFRNQVS